MLSGARGSDLRKAQECQVWMFLRSGRRWWVGSFALSFGCVLGVWGNFKKTVGGFSLGLEFVGFLLGVL